MSRIVAAAIAMLGPIPLVAGDHWAFRPVGSPTPPGVPAGSPVDAFVRSRLGEAGVSPASPADARTLARRLSYGLTGLPPGADEFDQLAPDGYERLADRLLASPAYGERWGRHWLDLARYADTKGYVFQEERNFPFSYTYRDYVIRSFNADRPYDEFIVHQLAADKLDLGGDNTPLAAMGFLTLGRRFLNNTNDIIDDRIDVVTRSLMGLTVSCARCHDHKYDPIPTEDYYSLYGVFASSKEPDELPLVGEPELTDELIAFRAELAKLEAGVTKFRDERHSQILAELREPGAVADYLTLVKDTRGQGIDEARKVLRERDLRTVPAARWKEAIEGPAKGEEPLLDELRLLLAAESVSRDALVTFAAREDTQRWLAGTESPLNIPADQSRGLFNRADRNQLRDLQKKVDEFRATSKAAPPRAMVLNDTENPVTPRVFVRGNPGTAGETVPRRFVSVIAGKDAPPFTDGSGRLELARAIASPANPLTARVLVNRVWGHHFGRGFVDTPSDFGTRSDPPTHPELLDHLASRFVESGWSIKDLQREIVLSDTYRQSVTAPTEDDPENRLLAGQTRRRLDWEQMRDSLLSAAGLLDRTMHGKSVELFRAPYPNRRAVYGFVERQNLPGVLRAFDFAGPDQHCPIRFETTVPQQALYLLNDEFVAEQARALVTRTEVTSIADTAEKIRAIYKVALGREPDAGEIELGWSFIQGESDGSQGMSVWARYAQVLLLSNEFAFLD